MALSYRRARQLGIGALLGIVLLMFVTGCSTSLLNDRSDLSELYGASVDAAAEGELSRNPVIVVPGLTGSRLVDETSG